MRTTYIKNTFLIASGIMLATSFGILAANPQPTSIQASLVNLVQYLGELHITSDGTPHGDDVLSINSNGNFVQTRSQDDIQYGLVNDGSVFGMPYVGAMASSGDYSYFAGIEKIPGQGPGQGLISVLGSMNLASGRVNYIGAKPEGIVMSHVSQVGVSDADNSIFVNESGIQFSFIGANNKYRFPTTPGQANQVLTTDGVGQLSWEDAGAGTSEVTEKITLSAQDILSLDTDSIELIPAPGIGKFIRLMDASIKYNFGSTAYQDNNYAWFYMCMTYPGATVTAYYDCVAASNILTLQNSSLRGMSFNDNAEMIEDEPLQINIVDPDSNDPFNVDLIAGDGTVDLYITYKILDL